MKKDRKQMVAKKNTRTAKKKEKRKAKKKQKTENTRWVPNILLNTKKHMKNGKMVVGFYFHEEDLILRGDYCQVKDEVRIPRILKQLVENDLVGEIHGYMEVKVADDDGTPNAGFRDKDVVRPIVLDPSGIVFRDDLLDDTMELFLIAEKENEATFTAAQMDLVVDGALGLKLYEILNPSGPYLLLWHGGILDVVEEEDQDQARILH